MRALKPWARLGLGAALLAATAGVRAASPEPFTFVERTGAMTSAIITSETKTPSGFSEPLPVSVTTADGAQYSVAGAAYTNAPGTITAGQTLRVRHTSASSAETPVVTVVTVGDYSTEFRSVTGTADRTPAPFTFGTKVNVEPGVPVESEPITLRDYNVGVAIVPGPGAEYRVAGGDWTAASGTLAPGQPVAARHTSSAQALGYAKTYVRIGGVTGYFTTRTRDPNAPPPDADGDGVPDTGDACPATPAGEAADANGCSASQRDADGDGVSDAIDQCAATPAGAAVDANGCSAAQRDTDGDGVNDDVDQCVSQQGPASNHGCPVEEAEGFPLCEPVSGDDYCISDLDEFLPVPLGSMIQDALDTVYNALVGGGPGTDPIAACHASAAPTPACVALETPLHAGLSRFVEPRVGSYPPGFTNPGPTAPFGMVQPGPDTEGPLNFGGYYLHNALITGFSQVHMSAGVYKARYFPALPFTGGDPDTTDLYQGQDHPVPAYSSAFDHATEVAEAGYYSAFLARYGVLAELTATSRVALHRYTFSDPAQAQRKILIDASRALDGYRSASVTVRGADTLTGSVHEGAFPVFFAARVSTPFTVATFDGAALAAGATASCDDGEACRLGVVLDLADASAPVLMKVAISYTDEAGALANLAEIPAWDFEAVRRATRAAWDTELARIEVEGGTDADKASFYTALYHMQQFPNVHSDVDGRYRGPDGAIRDDDARPHYSQFSSWDSYRGQNQMQAEIVPDRYHDMVRSLLAFHDQAGHLPRWQEGSQDASHMTGDPIVPFIGEAWCRGQIDASLREELWPALTHLVDRRSEELRGKGYLSVEPQDAAPFATPVREVNDLEQLLLVQGQDAANPTGGSSASATLEYGIADFSLALMGQSVTGVDTAAIAERSLNYRNLFDSAAYHEGAPDTKWIRPRNADGSWMTPFAPEIGYGFQEGTSWQYSWMVMHDYAGVFAGMGGVEQAQQRLDVLFNFPASAAAPIVWPTLQNQITLFGISYVGNQYAPGNEHDLQAPFVYNYTGAAWKTQAVSRAAGSIYTPTPNGLPGNDDLGALSGWLLWNMAGLYPMNPGTPLAVVGSPVFEKVTLHRPGGDLVIEAPGASAANKYVQSAAIDGTPWDRSWLLLPRGAATIRLEMGPAPNFEFGAAADARPPSVSTDGLAGFGCSVDAQADSDSDGVADGADQCPAEPGAAGLHGCPVPTPPPGGDEDDGTPDAADVCSAVGIGAADPLCGALRTAESELAAQCAAAGGAENTCTLAGGNLHALTETCYDASGGSAEQYDDDFPAPACRVVDSLLLGAAAHCRGVSNATAETQPSELCALFGGEQIGEGELQAYERSWVHAALRLQNRLGYDQPLVHASVVATHNSFNATDDNWPPALSGSDANQFYDIPGQLRMGVRAIEIDVHWMPGRAGTPEAQMREPMACHGNAQHFGCTHERPLRDVLLELRAWLDANPGEAIVLYIEDNLNEPTDGQPDGDVPYDTTGAVFEDVLGDLVYRPAEHGAACNDSAVLGQATSWLHVTRNDILRAGKQVLTYAETCGNDRPAWTALFHRKTDGAGGAIDQGGDQGEDTRYTPAYDQCVYSLANEASHWTRVWHDVTMVGAATGAGDDFITPAIARELMRCGMNMPSLDFLVPTDGRLEAMVWSWAAGEPSADAGANDCALQDADGRLVAGDCATPRAHACVGDADPASWQLSGAAAAGEGACPAGTHFSVPGNGYFNEKLKEAKAAAGVTEVWVNYVRTGAGRMDWTSDHDDAQVPGTGATGSVAAGRVEGAGLLGLLGEFFSDLGEALLALLDGDTTAATQHFADAFDHAGDNGRESAGGLAALLDDLGDALATLVDRVSGDPTQALEAADDAANTIAASASGFAGAAQAIAMDEGSCAPDNTQAASYLAFKGSLHEHSGYSDGRPGSEPRDYYDAAKFEHLDFMGGTEHSDNADVPMTVTDACLDFEAGPKCLVADDDDPADAFRKWDASLEQARAATDATFTAFRGFEWTSDRFGHINVFFSRHDWNAKTTEGYTASMESFWAWFTTRPELGGGADGLGVFNHPGREATVEDEAPNTDPAYAFNDFEYRAGADLRMVGIETFGKNNDIYDAMNGAPDGGWYAYALDKGWHVGAIGAEDEHSNGANEEWARPTRAKTILIARDRSEGALREALFARRFYSVRHNDNGIRLSFTGNGAPMGARLALGDGATVTLQGTIGADASRITALEIVTRGGTVVGGRQAGTTITRTVATEAGERWYYLRAIGLDGKPSAYSSPIWVRAGGAYPTCGEWLAGDLHVHTTYSHDSYGGPQEVAVPGGPVILPGDDNTGPEEFYVLGHTVERQFQIAAARGLDYLAISDHNDIRSQADPGFGAHGVVPVRSYENSLSGHAQMHGAAKLYDNGAKTAADVQRLADELRADGGVFQVNHPNDGGGDWPESFGWSYRYAVQPDTVEVWNIGPRYYQSPFPSNTNNDDSTRFWEGWLDRGAHVTATGGSDNHWVSTTAAQGNGQPTTWVFATERSQRGVLDALRAGRTAISHQPPLVAAPRVVLEADADGDGIFEAMTGATVPANAQLRARVVNAAGGLLRIIAGAPGERRVIGAPVPTMTPVFTYTFTAARGATWVRADVVEPDGASVRGAATTVCDTLALLGESGFPEDTDTTYCRNQLALLAMSSALYLGEPAAAPAPAAPPVTVTVTEDKVEIASALIERTWSRKPFRTERLVDGRTGKVWSEDSADFALVVGGAELASDAFEVVGEPQVERKPSGAVRTTFTLAPAGGVPAGLTLTRTVETYPDVAGMRSETWVHSAAPLAISGYSVDESRPQGAGLRGTIHSFRAGADWREPEWTGPQVTIGDAHPGDWRETRAGASVSGGAQWLSVSDAVDARLFYVLERNDYASSMMTLGGGRARAHVDLSRDVIYLGPIEETAHVENPGPGPGRQRVAMPGVPLRLEPVFTGLGTSGDDEPWQHYKYLEKYRMPPYRREITFNSNGVDGNRISTGAKDDMDIGETRRQAAIAAEIGVETFILDDGWQARSGDWCPDNDGTDDPACIEPRRGQAGYDKITPRFHDSTFAEVRDVLAAAGGMKLGLWMTPLHFHPSAVAFNANPQWACMPIDAALLALQLSDPDGSSNEAGLMQWNLEAVGPNGKAVDYVEGRIRHAIDVYGSKYFKFDFTVWLDCAGVATTDVYSYRESFMAMLDRILADHPDVTLQMDETNDYRLFPFEALARGPTWYQNGSPTTNESLHANHVLMPFLPPYALGRAALRAGDLGSKSASYQMAVALLSHMTFFNDLTGIPAAVRPQIRLWTDYFKAHRGDFAQFTYPLLAEDPLQADTWAAFQPWNPETGTGALLVYRQESAEATRTVRLRNVADGVYRLYEAPGDVLVAVHGAAQLRAGIDITLPSINSAKVLRIERLSD